MGFRFRKSINLGGGFKINLSKHGVGYSWGTKGFRVTKKSRGGGRVTGSLHGTGLSWSRDFGGKKRKSGANRKRANQSHNVQTYVSDSYDTQSIENSSAEDMVSDGLEDMLKLANKTFSAYRISWLGFWISLYLGFGFFPIWVISLAFIIYIIFLRTNRVISLDYNIDEDFRDTVNQRMSRFVNMTKCHKVWRIIQTGNSTGSKYLNDSSNHITRQECKCSNEVPFPFATEEQVASFKMKKETLIFLPDKLIIIQSGKIGALNYEDIDMEIDNAQFVETEYVPSDAKVINYTWEHVNKSGTPDRRYQNNRQLSVCLYGELFLRSPSGLNTFLMFSKPINVNKKL